MIINNHGIDYNVTIKYTKYFNGNLAICLVCDNGESYGNLTVNFDEKLPPNHAYVDTNNMPSAIKFIEENALGEFTGMAKQSGFCTYPLYKFKEI